MVIATDNGIRHVPTIYVRASRTMGSRRFHTWFAVALPASLPFLVTLGDGQDRVTVRGWRSAVCLVP
jgi:NitT/TauT family transport system permease protein